MAAPKERAPRDGGIRRRATALAVIAALLAPSALQADDDDARTRAMRLSFAHGLALEMAGRWADALDRFEEVARQRPTPNVSFHIALCLDRLGRMRKADASYRRARDTARVTAPEIMGEIDARLLDLDARMPRVVIGIAGATDGVRLLLDGAPIDPSTMVRVDPGPHVTVALRAGVPVAAGAFSVLERRTKYLTLTVYPPPWARPTTALKP